MGLAYGKGLGGQPLGEALLFAERTAQHGVDQPPGRTRHGHGFVYGRMRGDAQVENLVQPGAQQVPGALIQRAFTQLGDEKVQLPQVAQHPVEELRQQPAVGRLQRVTLQQAVQDFI